jgi:hypothetical protein
VTKRGAVELKGVNQMCRPWFDSTLSVRSFSLLFLLLLLVPFPIVAQKNEITLSLGGTPSQSSGFRKSIKSFAVAGGVHHLKRGKWEERV